MLPRSPRQRFAHHRDCHSSAIARVFAPPSRRIALPPTLGARSTHVPFRWKMAAVSAAAVLLTLVVLLLPLWSKARATLV
ncbi:MAG TPA: hypothetical protein VFG84_00075, partial [Gemmatimonadaceae bacterium]|nr:hypothetical protein [Gemmatimonadaceae bacterium]